MTTSSETDAIERAYNSFKGGSGILPNHEARRMAQDIADTARITGRNPSTVTVYLKPDAVVEYPDTLDNVPDVVETVVEECGLTEVGREHRSSGALRSITYTATDD